jgi:hypothetical protein
MLCRLALLTIALLTSPTPTESKKKRKRSTALATGVTVALPNVGPDEDQPLAVRLPAAKASSAGLIVRSASELMPHVSHAWDAVVAPHQAGLTEAKQAALEAAPLTATEAWRTYPRTVQMHRSRARP